MNMLRTSLLFKLVAILGSETRLTNRLTFATLLTAS